MGASNGEANVTHKEVSHVKPRVTGPVPIPALPGEELHPKPSSSLFL